MKIRLTVKRKDLYRGQKAFQKDVSGKVKRSELELSTLTKLLLEMLESLE